jgi:hypothetical protein
VLRFFDACCRVGRRAALDDECPQQPDEVAGQLVSYGIAQALTTFSWSEEHDATLGNAEMGAIAARHPAFVPCAVLLPPGTGEMPFTDDPAEVLGYLDSVGARAARICPARNSYAFVPTVVDGLLGGLAETAVPLCVALEEISWEGLDETLARHPGLRVILERVGYRSDRTLLPLLARHRGLHVEMSSLVGHRVLEEFRARIGPHRLLFASDLPFADPAAAMTRVLYAELDDESREAVAHGNLEMLLGRGDLP